MKNLKYLFYFLLAFLIMCSLKGSIQDGLFSHMDVFNYTSGDIVAIVIVSAYAVVFPIAIREKIRENNSKF